MSDGRATSFDQPGSGRASGQDRFDQFNLPRPNGGSRRYLDTRRVLGEGQLTTLPGHRPDPAPRNGRNECARQRQRLDLPAPAPLTTKSASRSPQA